MPASTQSYEVLLDFTNDLLDCVTIQLLRDYGQSTSAVVLLHPTETVTLVLESGSPYRYAVKTRTKVANVTAQSWRDINCSISDVFASTSSSSSALPPGIQPGVGVRVDCIWRDHRFCVWNES